MDTNDKFCPSCGSRLALRESEGQPRPVCPDCGRIMYYDPKLAATCVVEREGRESTFRRLEDSEGLREWLEEYSLSELWEKNVIGGRP